MEDTWHDTKCLDALCDLFDDELERQENVLRVSIAQGRAARAHDIELLEAKTEALVLLIREAACHERERLRLVSAVVAAYGLPFEEQTLSDLIRIVPEPWKRRMAEFQAGMVAILEETRRVTRENRRLMRRTLNVVQNTLALLQPEDASPAAYDAAGESGTGRSFEPSFIDQRG